MRQHAKKAMAGYEQTAAAIINRRARTGKIFSPRIDREDISIAA